MGLGQLDEGQPDPVLLDLKIKGQTVKAVVQANRNGFYYALDRATGKVLATRRPRYHS